MLKHAVPAAALIAVALAVPAAAPSAITPAAAASARHGGLERAVVHRVNAIRRLLGIRALRLSRGLGRAANAQSAAILGTDRFSHTPRGTTVGARVRRFVRARAVAEAIAWSTPGAHAGADGVVGQWLRSPPHRALLMDGRFRRAGVGRVHGRLGSTRAAVTTFNLATAR